MQSQEVNLAKHSASADDTFAVDEEIVAENIDEGGGIGGLALWRNRGLERCGD